MRVAGATLGEQRALSRGLRPWRFPVETWRPTLENSDGTASVSLQRQWACRGSLLTAEGSWRVMDTQSLL